MSTLLLAGLLRLETYNMRKSTATHQTYLLPLTLSLFFITESVKAEVAPSTADQETSNNISHLSTGQKL